MVGLFSNKDLWQFYFYETYIQDHLETMGGVIVTIITHLDRDVTLHNDDVIKPLVQ